ncbi:hypothetical protein PCANC_22780 [Puccinia coronata f. sp. avenae]|uniref:L-2-hydroxyglutarate dehydrogenase, mitochondrial n=1 Tax=Puccinia coronata f. sp. avenae TaxID=200324 RepID=A0A2N5S9L0_9BASI|nr:hypothetical protein PCANC_23802 [Puccinia coronata f. sp. avenae]PLW32445.1 hypothetical protein PCANC_22780 [Puccinia coronata f. sp. avenae]
MYFLSLEIPTLVRPNPRTCQLFLLPRPSRNSQVIHAGIYYPQDSLKTALCLRGRRLTYNYCRKHNVLYKKIGKLILARTKDERDYLEKLYGKCQGMNADEGLRRAVMFGHMEGRDGDLAPLRMMDQSETLALEPDLSPAIRSSLFSAETGIVDSHAFIASLETSINSSKNGEITQTSIDQPGDTGGERNSVLARCLVNCAGLNAHNFYNHVLYLTARRLQLGFCKGSYYSYGSAEGGSSVQHLIYPTPTQQKCTGNSFAGLGTHLTLDMNCKIKYHPRIRFACQRSSADLSPWSWSLALFSRLFRNQAQIMHDGRGAKPGEHDSTTEWAERRAGGSVTGWF